MALATVLYSFDFGSKSMFNCAPEFAEILLALVKDLKL